MKAILKPVIFVTSLCSVSAFAAVMAPQQAPAPSVTPANAPTAQPQADQGLASQVAQLQQEIDQLKKAQTNHEQAPAALPSRPIKSNSVTNNQHSVFGTFVVTGPSVGLPTHYDGSSLVVNSPSIGTAYRLLQRSATEQTELQKHGYQSSYPHIVLSGNLEGTVSYTKPYRGADQSDVNFTSAELDTYMEITPWINGFMTINYDDTPADNGVGRVENSRFFLDKGFISIGNLSKTPFYGTIGQEFVPFGRYSHVTISDPLTEYIGRTRVRTLTFGFHPNNKTAPYAEAFAFRGATTIKNRSRIDEGGADAGFAFTASPKVSGDFGASVISTIADAQGMLSTGNSTATPLPGGAGTTSTFSGFDGAGFSNLQHRVPAADLHGHLSMGPLTLVGDYIDTLNSFSRTDLSFRGKRAHVTAGNVEADLGFNSLFMVHRPVTFALSYSTTRQAVGLNLPKHRYMGAVQVAVMRDTLMTFGYRYDSAYGRSNTGGPIRGNTTINGINSNVLGRNSQALTANIDIYF